MIWKGYKCDRGFASLDASYDSYVDYMLFFLCYKPNEQDIQEHAQIEKRHFYPVTKINDTWLYRLEQKPEHANCHNICQHGRIGGGGAPKDSLA